MRKYQKHRHKEIQKSGKAESQNKMYCGKIKKYKTGSLFYPATYTHWKVRKRVIVLLD